MNKKVYLCNLEWTNLMKGHKTNGTPDFLGKGGVKANIVFINNMSFEEFRKISDNTYFYLTDEDYKSKIEEIKEYCEEIESRSIDYTDDDYDLGQDSVARDILRKIRGKE